MTDELTRRRIQRDAEEALPRLKRNCAELKLARARGEEFTELALLEQIDRDFDAIMLASVGYTLRARK